MATQDMVDFYTELLTTVLTCLTMFKLHGNMTQVERMDVFKSFKVANHGVLFCTVCIFHIRILVNFECYGLMKFLYKTFFY